MRNNFKCPRCGCPETNITGFNTFPDGAVYVAVCARACGGYYFCDQEGIPMVAPIQFALDLIELIERVKALEAYIDARDKPMQIN
jgi:hypothetical protein